jgi:hypothetical protein
MTIPSQAGAFPTNLRDNPPQRITIECTQCDTMTRVYRVEPAVKIGGFRFCPICGTNRTAVYQDSTTDHWESLARNYGLTVDLTKQIYDLWQPNECQHFGTFVKTFLSKLEATANET